MKKERLFYLDFVRAIAVLSIIITHFNARYLYLIPARPEKAVITTTVSNIYIGSWGVSLFFIISGAALMYVYDKKCEWRQFYKKRFLSIYPMFWLAYIIAFLFMFYADKTVPGGGTPKINFIFTVLGFDGLLAANIPTFYILGEWFLGVIIILYILFPLLRKLLNSHQVIFVVGMLIVYFLIIFGYNADFEDVKIIFTRLPEIVFGMLFVKWNKKVNWKVAVMSLAVLIANSILKPEVSQSLQTTYVGIASFLIIVYISYFVQTVFIEYVCDKISKYSYAIFLVHHVVIARMMAKFDLSNITLLHSYILFTVICCVIVFLSVLLYRLHAYIMQEINSCLLVYQKKRGA